MNAYIYIPTDRTIIYLFYNLVPHCTTWVFFRFHYKSNPFDLYCCEYPPYATAKPICWSSLQQNKKAVGQFFANPYLTDEDFAWPVNQPKAS